MVFFYRKKSLALLLVVCFLLTMITPTFVQGAAVTGNSLPEARDGVVDFYQNNKTTLGSWREVVALKEAGVDITKSPWVLPDWEIGRLAQSSPPTDYAGTILALLAAGQNPKQVQGRDLVAELAAMQQDDGSFGEWFNYTLWAVIALDKAKGSYDEAKAVEYIISQQKEDGGFALFGETGDPDVTGETLVALAPHSHLEGVTVSINRACECLKNLQLPNGGFASWGAENPESAAAVIRGLLACGETNITSGDWQKSKGNMIDALFSFQLEDGSFVHATSETSYNSMATEQALQAIAEMVNAGINYTVKTGKRHIPVEELEATVRVRVEGATASLADKTVTVTGGTAFDALIAAVGEENLVASGDYVISIFGESGTRIESGLYSGWMYYVIRDGAVDLDGFNLMAGSYELKDGDEVIFYIAAYQTVSPYAVKTYLPEVRVSPVVPTAGQALTLSLSALKLNETWDRLVPLDSNEAAAIGDFTVMAGDRSYTSQFGQVLIPDLPEGTFSFTVTNHNEKGYPDVVTFKGAVEVGEPLVSSVRVRVEGAAGSLKDATVKVTGTAMDALKAAVGEGNVVAPGGFITEILGESGKRISEQISTNWMYFVIRDGTIDQGAFSQGAAAYNVRDGDEVVFYIGAMDTETWAEMTFFPLVSITPDLPRVGEEITVTIKTMKNDWLAGLVELTAEELNAIGEYTVLVGQEQFITQEGQVTFRATEAGAFPLIITNQNEAGYPNVVTYRGTIEVRSAAVEDEEREPGPTQTPGSGVEDEERKTGLPQTAGESLPLCLAGIALLSAGILLLRKKQLLVSRDSQ